MAESFAALQVVGLSQVLDRLKEYPKEVQEDVDFEMNATALEIAAAAKIAAPVDTGGLQNAISASKNKPMDYEVVAQKHFAPYVEFGTGLDVDVPAGLEDYAIQFKGEGKRQVNLPARPYLFPAYEKARVALIATLKKKLGAK